MPHRDRFTASLRVRAYRGEIASATYCYFIGEPDYALSVMKITAPPGTVTGSIYENYMGSREVKINLRGNKNVIMRAMLTNAFFRMRFLARLAHELSTIFSIVNVFARIGAMEQELKADVPHECRRWGRSMGNWREQVERLRDFARDGCGKAADRAGLLAATRPRHSI